MDALFAAYVIVMPVAGIIVLALLLRGVNR